MCAVVLKPTLPLAVAASILALSSFAFAAPAQGYPVQGYPAQGYDEALDPKALAEAGALPPVEERLPESPLVAEPHEMIGDYGGTWRAVFTGSSDKVWLIRVWLIRTVGYETLMRWDLEWTRPIPSVEFDQEGRVYTFKLRPGMRWSDGAPFTADDILFAFESVIAHPALGGASSWIKDGDNLPEIEALDAQTFRVTFKNPNGLFIANLAIGEADVFTRFPRHDLSRFHADHNPEITPYDGSTTVVAFERNPYYWKIDPKGHQLLYIDEVGFQATKDREVALLKAIRVALSHGIDRQEIIDTVYVGLGEPRQVAPRLESRYFNKAFAKQYTEHDPALRFCPADGHSSVQP